MVSLGLNRVKNKNAKMVVFTRNRKRVTRRFKADTVYSYNFTWYSYRLISLGNGFLTKKQVDLVRFLLSRMVKGAVNTFNGQNFSKKFSEKAKGTRMGGGLGNVVDFGVFLRPGSVLFEFPFFIKEQLDTFDTYLLRLMNRMPVKLLLYKKAKFSSYYATVQEMDSFVFLRSF